MKESMEETIGEVEVELDGTFASLRTKETNLGNIPSIDSCSHHIQDLLQETIL
jgi:hypothetical protein